MRHFIRNKHAITNRLVVLDKIVYHYKLARSLRTLAKSDMILSLSIGDRAHNTELYPFYNTVLFWNATPITIAKELLVRTNLERAWFTKEILEVACFRIYQCTGEEGRMSEREQKGKWTRDASWKEVLEKIDVKWILSVGGLCAALKSKVFVEDVV